MMLSELQKERDKFLSLKTNLTKLRMHFFGNEVRTQNGKVVDDIRLIEEGILAL